MKDMTEEEYDALDERLTNTIPTLSRIRTGFFTRKGSQAIILDEETAKILNAKAIASRQTPSEIVISLLRKELTVAEVHG